MPGKLFIDIAEHSLKQIEPILSGTSFTKLILILIFILPPDLVQGQMLIEPDGDNLQTIVQGITEDPLDLSEPEEGLTNNNSFSTVVLRRGIYDDRLSTEQSEGRGSTGRPGAGDGEPNLVEPSEKRQSETEFRLTPLDERQPRQLQPLEFDLSGVTDPESAENINVSTS